MPDAAAQIALAARLLRAGKLVAFPTETVYGLGADAQNELAVRAIFAAKGRPADHPVIVHVADASELQLWAREIPPAARALANSYWPGPLTLVLPRSALAGDWVTGGQDTVGLRSPAHPLARALLAAFGGALAAPSANRYGHVSPTLAQHVREELGDAVSLVLDGGACPLGIESTIVAFANGKPMLLRPGSITEGQVVAVAGPLADAAELRLPMPRVPGSAARHYAPYTPVELVEAAALPAHLAALLSQDLRVGVLARSAAPAGTAAPWRAAGADAASYAHSLYGALRGLDRCSLNRILIEAVPDTAEWAAVRDRLARAVTP